MATQINDDDNVKLRIVNQLLSDLQQDLEKVWHTIIRLDPGHSDPIKLTFGVLKQCHDAVSAVQAGNRYAIEHPQEFAEKMAEVRSLNRKKDK